MVRAPCIWWTAVLGQSSENSSVAAFHASESIWSSLYSVNVQTWVIIVRADQVQGAMMMLAFITFKSSLVPLLEGL